MRSLRRTKTKETSIKVKSRSNKGVGWKPGPASTPHLSTLHTTRSENTKPSCVLRSPALQTRFIIKRRDAPRGVIVGGIWHRGRFVCGWGWVREGWSGVRCVRSLTAVGSGRCAGRGLGLLPVGRGHRAVPVAAQPKERQASGWRRRSGLRVVCVRGRARLPQ